MLYTTYFRVTTDAENQWIAARKAAETLKKDPVAFLTGTFAGTGKKKKSILSGLFFGY